MIYFWNACSAFVTFCAVSRHSLQASVVERNENPRYMYLASLCGELPIGLM